MTRRRSIFPDAALVLAASLTVLAARPPAAQTARPVSARAGENSTLTLGSTFAHDLARGQSHVYRVALQAGQFVHIVVEQQGIDVVATLIRPDGRVLGEVDSLNDDFRAETLVAIVDVGGNYTVGIRPAAAAAPAGRYTIRVEELRDAQPQDNDRIEAERAYINGRRLRFVTELGNAASGLDIFQGALSRFRQLSDRRGELKALLEISWLQARLFRPESFTSAEDAHRLAESLDDKISTARALAAMAYAKSRRGEPAAIRLYEQSRLLSQALGDRKTEAMTLSNLGIEFGIGGDAERAVQHFERALALARASNGRFLEYPVLNNLGIAYKDLGEYEKSLHSYESALASRGDRAPQSDALPLINMGNLLRVMHEPRKALELHGRALELSRQTDSADELESRALNTIGFDHFALGEYDQAMQYHAQALAIRRRIQDRSGIGSSLDGVGRAAHRLGRQDEALAALREALTIRHDIRDEYGESDTLRNLAAVERDRGNIGEALVHIEAAVKLEEAQRGRITSPQLRTTFASAELDKHEMFIDLLQQQHQADPAGGHAAAALHVSERSRARVMLESLAEARLDLRQGVEPALLERERATQKQLNDTSARLSRALAGQTTEEVRASAARQLERVTGEYQEIQRQMRLQSPRYAALTQPQPLTAAEIQRDVLDDHTVLLEFALGEDRSWLWAVTKQTITSVELSSRKELEAAARALYGEVTARQPRDGEAPTAYARRVAAADRRLRDRAAAVSRLLLGGIAEQLQGPWRGKRLVIVPAGALEYLPFGSLPLPQVADRRDPAWAALPLIAQHEVVEAPSASVLATLRREAAGREPARRAVAVLADPVFDPADPRVAVTRRAQAALSAPRATPPSDTTPAMAYLSSRAVQRIADMRGRGGLARLPFSRDEATAIASLAGRDGTLSATDFRASRASTLGQALEQYRIVHFATHGLIDDERPALSGLILSLVDERGASQDGFLRLHDIFNMRLNAELVVLSACQTALGKEIKGEGLVGLTRGFMYAGAPRVVASLWQVSDLATAELMKKFYAGMLQRHLPAAAALRSAQREMADDRRWASPYFWAGFVLQGDWK